MIEIKRILCPVDFSEYSDHALAYAIKMAQWYGSEVHVLHVMPLLPPSTVNGLAESSRQMTAGSLAAAVERARTEGVTVTTQVIESGEAAPRILECAEAIDADLIVTGSHGRKGVSRIFLGSIVELLLHRSRRPVLAIPSHLDAARLAGPISFERIVCAVDFAVASLAGLEHALSIAEESDARLTLLHVIEKPPELDHAPPPPEFDVDLVRAEAEAERLVRLRALVPEGARDFCTVETAVLEGGVARQVLRKAAAENADLIVLGVHGRSPIDLTIFGSNSAAIIRDAHCPVLVVPTTPPKHTMRRAS